MKSAFIIASLMLMFPLSARAETLTNQSILDLIKAGMGDEVVIAKIKVSPTQFNMSTDHIIALKQAGVSGPVIAAMIGAPTMPVSAAAAYSADSPDPKVPHPSGVYLFQPDPAPGHMARINPTTSNQTKSGGFLGYALTGGIASLSFKAVLPNASARIFTTAPRPVFYFYFDQTNANLSSGAGFNAMFGPGAAVTSPSEFSLVRFEPKENRRETKVGKFNITGAKSGVMDKDRISFEYDQVTPGVFRVSPANDLKPGEYGFLYSVSSGGLGIAGAGNMMARVFDFSIRQ